MNTELQETVPLSPDRDKPPDEEMRIFASILDETLQSLSSLGFKPDKIEDKFIIKVGAGGNLLKSYSLSHALGTQMRCSEIQGPKAQMINFMIYPVAADRVPVFASEFVYFGGKIVVAVIDLQPTGKVTELRSKIDSLLMPYYYRYAPLLTQGGEIPNWAREHFTRYCIYSRPETLGEINLLIKAHKAYLDLWGREFLPLEKKRRSGEQNLWEYQTHHVANIPSRPFLSKIFGSEWTEDYFNGFLYQSR